MMAYIPSSQLYHSALADFLAANANAFSAHSHSSPGAVRMENQLIRWNRAIEAVITCGRGLLRR